ncbi:MAG: hypothetical protein KGL35_27265 [Bradyrhizobium sp.]|nr:hypothetical protein [Bradyrhizobium sp.]
MASPIALTIPGEDFAGNKMFLLKAVGGLTKLEHVAAMVAGTSIEAIYAGKPTPEDMAEIATVSVNIAEALLAECAKRQAPKAEKPVFEGAE